MNGGKVSQTNGTKETKVGNDDIPSILNTFKLALKLIFFNEKSFVIIFLDNRITLNLITIFLFMFSIPVKDILEEKIVYSPGKIVEGIMITFIYIFILYMFTLGKKIKFVPFLRLFLAIETVDIFSILVLFLKGKLLMIATSFILGWYLSLSVVFLVRLLNINRIRAFLIVIFTFLFVNMIPALFA
jgi:hypothetical protein